MVVQPRPGCFLQSGQRVEGREGEAAASAARRSVGGCGRHWEGPKEETSDIDFHRLSERAGR